MKQAISQTNTNTKSILMYLPKDLYYKIKMKADQETMTTGTKKTIHDKVLELILVGINK